MTLLLLCSTLLLAVGVQATPTFVDGTQAAGIDFRHISGTADKHHILEAHGSGAALFDADSDGDLDLYIVNGATFDTWKDRSGPGNALFRNQGAGTFADVSAAAGVDDGGWGAGVAVGDIDNDGSRDLYVTNYAGNVLYRNRGDGTFADITDTATVAGDEFSAGAAFVDIDNDGDLDLYVTNYVRFDADAAIASPPRLCSFYGGLQVYCGPKGLPGAPDVLYRNNGDLTFTDVTDAAGISAANRYYGLGVIPADFDADGDMDLAVANDETPNVLWSNDGAGRFTDVALMAGVAYNGEGDEEAGMGVDTGDVDGDGDDDLYLTHFFSETNTLYRNDGVRPDWGGLRFTDITAAAGLAAPTVSQLAWGTRFFDADQDGDLDLIVANGHVYPQVDRGVTGSPYRQPDQLFANRGDGVFDEVSKAAGLAALAPTVSRGIAVGDTDQDGDVDVFVSNLDDAPRLLVNTTVDAGHWLLVQLVGSASNRDGIGARIRVDSGGRSQWRTVSGAGSYLSAHDVRAHFGLGPSATVDEIEVTWPDGSVQTTGRGRANRLVIISQSGAVQARVLPHTR